MQHKTGYVREYQLAVVMPDVQRSFSCDFRGLEKSQFYKYVSRELIDITRRMFNLSDRREDTFVAGQSMGGFGAFKLALNCPETFGAGASIAGALNMERLYRRDLAERNELHNYMEPIDSFLGSIDDLFAAAKRTNALAVKPRLFQCCGTGDFTLTSNLEFRDIMRELSYDYTYETGPGGHDWEYFDKGMQMILFWLGLEKA